MAIDQLGLYNDALLLLGQTKLDSLTEDREPRYRLDGAYTRDAIETCTKLVKPNFATKTGLLNTPVAGSTFDYEHDLPADYTAMVMPFSDKRLDQPITRYLIEGNKLLCDFDTVYLRYVTNAADFDDWDPTFIRVVGAYLATEVGERLSPDRWGKVKGIFDQRVAVAIELEGAEVPESRPSKTNRTLTQAWLKVYNDALQIMGLDELAGLTDDSNRRVKIDVALDAGLVEAVLEDTGWQFGIKSVRLEYDINVDPSWGYKRATKKPDDLHRIDGVFADEYMQVPIKLYTDEDGYFFSDYDEIYLQYISKDFLTNPSSWPTHFNRLIAARIAKDASPALRREGADPIFCASVFEERDKESKSIDAMGSPPRLIQEGRWTSSRNRTRSNYRGRP